MYNPKDYSSNSFLRNVFGTSPKYSPQLIPPPSRIVSVPPRRSTGISKLFGPVQVSKVFGPVLVQVSKVFGPVHQVYISKVFGPVQV